MKKWFGGSSPAFTSPMRGGAGGVKGWWSRFTSWVFVGADPRVRPNKLYGSTQAERKRRTPTKVRQAVAIGLIAFLIFALAGGTAIYNQFFKNTEVKLAYPATPIRGGRILNFQGFLTDSAGTPITTSINMRYRLYDAASGGTTLYDSGTCSITPDADGIVNVLVGSSCGAEIASTVFSENVNVYMGVTTGADAEMTPRQQIANVGYAINSETLQGLPPGTGTSNVPFINRDGNMLIAVGTPGLRSTYASATFQLSSANAISLISAGTGDITLNATESGAIKLLTANTTGNQVQATNANLSTGSLYYGAVANDNAGYNLIQLKSGSSLTDKFYVTAAGTGYFAGDVTVGNGSRLLLGQNASALTGVNGAMYYDTTLGKFRCYQAGAWTDCVGGSISPDSLDFIDFQDTMDLDANLIMNQAAYSWTQNYTGTSTTGYIYNANSLTSGNAVNIASTATG